MKNRPIYALGPELVFPPVEWARSDGLLAVHGDLSVERLLLAYQSGIFPWYGEDAPILWWAPPKRAVIEPGALHVSRSMRKVLRRDAFQIRMDHDFAATISGCASSPRPGQDGTWIVDEMQEAYVRLHEAGFAHSVECYRDGALVGGLYGVSLGGCFFGESMFSRVPNASKAALIALCEQLHAWQFDLVDCQIQNDHLAQFGVHQIPRAEFMARLRASLQKPTRRGRWVYAPTGSGSGSESGSGASGSGPAPAIEQ